MRGKMKYLCKGVSLVECVFIVFLLAFISIGESQANDGYIRQPAFDVLHYSLAITNVLRPRSFIQII